MKKILLILLVSLIGISFFTVANSQTFSLWKLASNALFPVNSAWELGSSATRIVKGWFTNLDVSGVFTLGGTVASGGLNLNGEKLIFDADATTWMQSTDTQDYIFFVNNNATTTAINNLGYWGYGTSTPALPLSVQASSSSGYFGISNTQDNDIFYINGSGNIGIGTNAPAQKLDVRGKAIVGGVINGMAADLTVAQDGTGGMDTLLYLKVKGNASAGRGIAMSFSAPFTDAGGAVENARIEAINEGNGVTNKVGFAFQTLNGTALAERVRIDSSGFLGIATTSPTFGLELMASSTDGYFGIGDNGKTGNVFVIDEQGYVGIATATPQSLLQVGTPLDDTNSYMQMDVKTDTPPATDCDVDNEAGRFIFLSSSTDAFYICKGSGGWASTTLP